MALVYSAIMYTGQPLSSKKKRKKVGGEAEACVACKRTRLRGLCAAHAHACGAEQCMDTEALEEEEFFSCYIVFESEH